MDILIDGHNLAFKLFYHTLEDPEALHTRLINYMLRFTHRTGNQCFIIFDSCRQEVSELFQERKHKPQVRWLFAPDADEELYKYMKELKSPEKWLIISSDKEIINFAKSLNVKHMLSSKFARAVLFWINGGIVYPKVIQNSPYRRFGKPVPITQVITIQDKIKYAILDLLAYLKKD